MQIRSFLTKTLLLWAVLLLPACSYFDSEPVNVSSEQVDLMEPTAPSEITLSDAVRSRTNGSVEIYDLDAPIGEDIPQYVPSRSPSVQPSYIQTDPMAVEREDILNQMTPVEQMGYQSDAYNPGVEEEMQRAGAPASWNPDASLPPSMPEPSAEPSSAQVQRALTPDEEGLVVVYFDYGSATLSVGDVDKLKGLAARFDPARGVGLDVMGHASVSSQIDDPVARKVANLKESMDRAFAVARVLIENGIPPEALRVSGWGEVRPPDPSLGYSGDLNDDSMLRRVEIFSQ